MEVIKQRTLSVVKLKKPDERAANEADMSGPLLLALAFGSLLLLVEDCSIYNNGIVGKDSFRIYLWIWIDGKHHGLHYHEHDQSSID